MTAGELAEAFKSISREDVLSKMALDRDPVSQLTEICEFLLLVEDWVKQAKQVLVLDPAVELQGAVASAAALVDVNLPRAKRCLANAIKARDKGVLTHPRIDLLSSDEDPATNCMTRQQEINRETLENLSDADTLSERWDAIESWGYDTKENLSNCLDQAFDQFDEGNEDD